jgi:cell division protein FtsB
MPNTSPNRSRMLAAVALMGVLGAGYLVYEAGRLHAGYNRLEASREREELADRIAALEAREAALREEVIKLETLRKTDQEAYKAIDEGFRSLQDKIQEQREAIAFYRGIISPADSSSGLRVQDFQVLRGAEESRYRLRLVLVQVKQHHRRVSGTVRLSVDGARGGEAVTIPFAQLAADDDGRWAFSFRYFQDFERELLLPEGFRPDRVNIELMPSGSGNSGIKQSFPWSTSPG